MVPVEGELDTCQDPVEDLDLQGFSLLLVGATLFVHPSMDSSSSQKELLWAMVYPDGEGKEKTQQDPKG